MDLKRGKLQVYKVIEDDLRIGIDRSK